jgi:hypothetical protein
MMLKIRNPKDVRDFHLALQPQLETILGSTTYQNIAEYLQSPEFEMEETETIEEVPVAAAPRPAPQSSEPLVQPAVAPMPMAPTPPPPAQGQQAASPTTRSQYAAMFPYDTASEVIKGREGIASLMS